MPQTVLAIVDATLTLKIGAATASDFSCQVISAALTATSNPQQVPATFCTPAKEVPAPSSWALDVTYLQDWTDPAGLSMYLYENDAAAADFTLTLSGATEPSAAGTVYLVAGGYGGDAGVPLQATVTLPCADKPVITAPAAIP